MLRAAVAIGDAVVSEPTTSTLSNS